MDKRPLLIRCIPHRLYNQRNETPQGNAYSMITLDDEGYLIECRRGEMCGFLMSEFY